MGIIKGSLKLVGNVVTLGGVSRLEDAQTAYQESFDRYQNTYKNAKSVESEIHANVNAIGMALKKAKKSLDKGEAVLNGTLRAKTKWIGNIAATTSTLTQVAKFQKEYGSVSSIGAGVVTGSTMAIGSWALVSTFGAASTGAVIAELSGVAATNATLAWFGGGSLAVGGAGMSGGAIVLGGLVAIPLVIVAAKGTHKKAKEIEEETTKVEGATVKLRELIDSMNEVLPAVQSKNREADQTCGAFVGDIACLRKIIRPWGIFSLLKQKIYGWFGKNPFSEQQQVAILNLNSTISVFLTWFRGSNADLRSSTTIGLLAN
ncbi:hypothetical protein B0G80_7397 [Paraburkholderia sp. BL6669N2]|uniref:hypothetical protein n=1 Tax=Paraburkholderia sp. BL6669N2 TaxID=1938807 RepID=UPI000E22A647|nr:hypothetical protein [Paraburkholderia sp. BL6669N2]REG50924.1 hypothetical protein B0G80_7397 [Paraburkholderia sp. BL6669N2]